MTIRHRIMILIALTFIAIFSIGGYAILQARSNASEVKSVTEGVVPSALATSDLVSELKQTQLAAMTLVYAPNESAVAVSKEKLLSKKKTLQDGLNLQLKQATNATQKGLVKQAQESLANYFSSIDESMEFKLQGQMEIAEASLYGNVAQYQSELEAIVETLRVEKNRSKDEAIAALNSSLSKTTTGTTIFTFITVIVLSVIGIFLYRRIITPMRKMQVTMSDIASSQDFSRQVEVERMDEIGHSILAFNKMIEKIQESSLLVKQKNNDIQAMLQNMQQGILTIIENNKIHPEYSAYLENILENKEIAGRNMMEIVFSNTNLGSDALSQLEAVAGACIGEDVMNFEFNEHLLPGEIEKTMPNGKTKTLDLSWSPITNDEEIIVRLMLCVRDVTELRKLAAEATEQKRELEIIGEILSVSQEKFHGFITSSLKFIDENELLIRENPKFELMAITQMFRNMHTIKGNARTYGLHHLTNTVHEAEQYYDELRKPHPSIAWDQTKLMDDLLTVRGVIEHYAKTNEVSLGRKGPGRRVGVEHFLMVDRKEIQDTLQRLETVNTSNIHELIAVRDTVRKTLRLLGTERIVETLESVFESLPSLAKELHKLPPMIDIQDNGYVLRTQVSGSLKNVFMHLLRNAMDHGIEVPEERQLSGKPLAGNIKLNLAVTGGMLHINVSDDGRGLALARMRKIAIDKNLINPEDQLDDEEVAKLMFRPGFSTAEKVTEVSGRGVGMDAVVDLVKRESGKIEIRFTDNLNGADFRQFEIVVSLPESVAENTEGFDFISGSTHSPMELGLIVQPDAASNAG